MPDEDKKAGAVETAEKAGPIETDVPRPVEVVDPSRRPKPAETVGPEADLKW